MSKESTDHSTESRPEWDHLEDWLRGQVQGMVQYMLEEEVTESLGRLKSAQVGMRQQQWLPERIRSSSEADALLRDDTCQASEGAATLRGSS